MKREDRAAPTGPLFRIRPRCWPAYGVLPILLGFSIAAHGATPEIHRCIQDDGTVAFRETPCPKAAPSAASDGPEVNTIDSEAVDNGGNRAGDDFFDFTNPFDEPVPASQEPEPAPNIPPPELPSQDRLVCEQSTREAIDAIEVQMRTGYTREEGQAYLGELLELTRQLRACKEL